MGGFSDLKRHQALKPENHMISECHQSKYFDMEHIPGIINRNEIFKKKMTDNIHFRNFIDSTMFSLQTFLKYRHNVPSHIISDENPSLLFHMVVTHSFRPYRTQIDHSRKNWSNHSGTIIGSQTNHVKRYSLHLSRQGGVDRSQVNEYWP